MSRNLSQIPVQVQDSSLQYIDNSINTWVPTQEDLYDLSQIYHKVTLHRAGLSQSNISSRAQITARSHSNPRSNCSIIKEKLQEARINSTQSTYRQARPDIPLHRRENKPSKSCNEIDQNPSQRKHKAFHSNHPSFTSLQEKGRESHRDYSTGAKAINLPKQFSIKKKDRSTKTLEGKLQFDMSSIRSDCSLVWYEEEDSNMDCSIKGESVRRDKTVTRIPPKHEELNIGKKLKGILSITLLY